MHSALLCMPQVVVRITDTQMAWLEGQVEQFRPKSVVIRDLIDSAMKGLHEGARLSAYHVGAGNTYSYEKPPLQFPPDLEVTPTPASTEAVPSKKKNSLETLSLTPELEKFEDLIREFFRLKKGSKSKTAWAHLMGGLKKIQDKYGDAVVKEQLMAAINGRWNGITLKNYEEFGKPKPKPQWVQDQEKAAPDPSKPTVLRVSDEALKTMWVPD